MALSSFRSKTKPRDVRAIGAFDGLCKTRCFASKSLADSRFLNGARPHNHYIHIRFFVNGARRLGMAFAMPIFFIFPFLDRASSKRIFLF